MSRPTNQPRPDDPDDTPTRIGGTGGAGDAPGAEDATVPSLQKSGETTPPQPPPAAKRPSNDPLIGKELGGCRIDSLLGRGAMGAVYKARQLRLDRDVAVKVIRPEMMTDARTLKRFEVEARTVGRFNSAHVVMVHDVGFERGVHFLVMEFVQGKNLRDHVKLLAGGRLPAAEAIPLLRQACKGLEEAQRLSVIHRDIKPDNLMLTDRGILKIADFGIAKPIQEDFNMTLTSELIGTPLYMSPEQCQSVADLDFRSDMYSLGATFYYLLTGEPPVRASSVYELIQTKTKLENLCLWKALPDLDQNHPLSRVVERMTALNREDRYESYEALLNDIVLVEQGGTVQRMAQKPVRTELPKLPPAPPKRGRTAALATVALVVVAGAGGYWWSAGGEENSSTTNTNSGGAVKPDPKVTAAKLLDLHARLAQEGPSERLRDDVKAVAADGPEGRDKQLLLADVVAGLGAKKRLQGIKPPATLELPFTDLRDHLQSVEQAITVDGTPGASLQKWLKSARSEARADQALGPKAQSRLLGAFAKWKDDRSKVGGEKNKLAELDERLTRIEQGRHALTDLVPTSRADLDQNLPVSWLDAARIGLAEDTTLPTDVDVSSSLVDIQRAFDESGPDEALIERTRGLRPTKVDQGKAREDLLNELGRAKDRKNDAESTRTSEYPRDPRLPFDDVATFFQKLDLALEKLRNERGELRPWAEALRTRLRDEAVLQSKVALCCGSTFEAWKKQRDTGAADPAQLASLTIGIERAVRLFPGAKAEIDRVVPPAELAQLKAGLDQAAQRQQWLASARELRQRFAAVSSIAEWRLSGAQLVADVEVRLQAVAAFPTDPDVQREMTSITDARNRWTQANTMVQDFAAKIAAGDLTGAEVVARVVGLGNEGKEELGVLGVVAARCREAFAALDLDLNIKSALSLLGEARTIGKPVVALAPAADERIGRWLARIGELQSKANGLVAIPGGRVRGLANPIDSFFLSPTEVSHADFSRFLKDLRGAVNGIDEPARRLATVAPRLDGIGLTEEVLAALLAAEPRRSIATLPADRLTWHAAAAYAAWNGQSLPTLGEWSLAAFGDGNKNKYPWGALWSFEGKDRNSDQKSLANVDDGGICWRVTEGRKIHHLAGNVAEWLQADPTAQTATLAGGKFNDSEPKAKEQAEGNVLSADKSDGRQGFGARTVLRPRSFPGLEWPR